MQLLFEVVLISLINSNCAATRGVQHLNEETNTHFG